MTDRIEQKYAEAEAELERLIAEAQAEADAAAVREALEFVEKRATPTGRDRRHLDGTLGDVRILEAMRSALPAAKEHALEDRAEKRRQAEAERPRRDEDRRIRDLARQLLALEARLGQAIRSVESEHTIKRVRDAQTVVIAAALREYKATDVRDVLAARAISGRNWYLIDRIEEHVHAAARLLTPTKESR